MWAKAIDMSLWGTDRCKDYLGHAFNWAPVSSNFLLVKIYFYLYIFIFFSLEPLVWNVFFIYQYIFLLHNTVYVAYILQNYKYENKAVTDFLELWSSDLVLAVVVLGLSDILETHHCICGIPILFLFFTVWQYFVNAFKCFILVCYTVFSSGVQKGYHIKEDHNLEFLFGTQYILRRGKFFI